MAIIYLLPTLLVCLSPPFSLILFPSFFYAVSSFLFLLSLLSTYLKYLLSAKFY